MECARLCAGKGPNVTKRELFAREYIVDLNATKAAERAGYSAKSAYSQGHRLLKDGEVKAEIQRLMDQRGERLEITADKVLQELGKLAFFDVRSLFNSDGSPKNIHELDGNSAAAVAGLEVHELFDGAGDQKHAYGLCRKIRLADKGQNLERLAKHLQLFNEKPDGDDGLMNELIDAINRS
jgi:phage terminase small subunit